MAGKPAPIPTPEDPKRMILCIEDLKQAGNKKMPEGIRGGFLSITPTATQAIALKQQFHQTSSTPAPQTR